MKRCIVIGLGNFGYTTAKTLYDNGIDVMAVDFQEDIVNAYKDALGVTVCCDATNVEQLLSLQIRNFDAAVIAIGQNMTSSILISLHLQELKIKRIVVRAISGDHAKILEKLGVSDIVYPEIDTAVKTANKLMMKNVADFLHISDEYSVIEIPAPASFIGKNLVELNITGNYSCQVLGIKYRRPAKNGDEDYDIVKTIIAPHADDIIKKHSLIIILGKKNDIVRIQKIN